MSEDKCVLAERNVKEVEEEEEEVEVGIENESDASVDVDNVRDGQGEDDEDDGDYKEEEEEEEETHGGEASPGNKMQGEEKNVEIFQTLNESENSCQTTENSILNDPKEFKSSRAQMCVTNNHLELFKKLEIVKEIK